MPAGIAATLTIVPCDVDVNRAVNDTGPSTTVWRIGVVDD